MTKKFTNNAYSKLASPVLTSDTSFTVTAGDGVKFPVLGAGDTCHCTLMKSDGTNEIVLITARATDVFTMTRAQENTSAMAFNAGDRVEQRLTAGDIAALQTAAAAAQSTADGAVTAASTADEKAVTADAKAVAAQETADAAFPKAGGNVTGSINEAKAADVASAGAPDIWVGNGNTLHITGTTTITGFHAAPQAGAKRRLICDAAVPITASANMIVAGCASGETITLDAGDIVDVIADSTTQFRLTIAKLNGKAIVTKFAGAVRQAINYAPVNSNGYADLGGSTGSASVTTTAISSSAPLVVNAAAGMAANGELADRIGASAANLTWTGLSTNGTMQLSLDVGADGSLTPVSGALLTTYQQGGTLSTVNGQHTFNYGVMNQTVGNGTLAVQSYRVAVGEVTVAGGVVTSITWYALNGRYDSGLFAVAASTKYSKSHNLGTTACETDVHVCFDSSGTNERKMPGSYYNGSANAGAFPSETSRNSVSWTTFSFVGVDTANAQMTSAFYRFVSRRAF